MKPFGSLLDRRGAGIGTWSQFANPEAVDILGGSGFYARYARALRSD